jgi:hypothetical protein
MRGCISKCRAISARPLRFLELGGLQTRGVSQKTLGSNTSGISCDILKCTPMRRLLNF